MTDEPDFPPQEHEAGAPRSARSQEPPPPPPPPPPPLSAAELSAALLRPHVAIEHALGSCHRLASNVTEQRALPWAVALLAAVSVLTALPYGAVLPPGAGLERDWTGFWRVAALYTGSLAICFPSLHVFSQFMGCRLGLLQNLVLSLLVSSVAAAFSLGFAPIVWFIDTTTDAAAGAVVGPERLSAALLTVALVMGVIQMVRCLGARDGIAARGRLFRVLIAAWLVLLLFITARMGDVLGVW